MAYRLAQQRFSAADICCFNCLEGFDPTTTYSLAVGLVLLCLPAVSIRPVDIEYLIGP